MLYTREIPHLASCPSQLKILNHQNNISLPYFKNYVLAANMNHCAATLGSMMQVTLVYECADDDPNFRLMNEHPPYDTNYRRRF